MATIFDALRYQIGQYSAVTALVANRIRPMRFATRDDLSKGAGLLIDPLKEENQLDLSASGGAESLRLRFRCVASGQDAAYAVARALYTNGQTPAAGLNGFTGTVQGVPILAVALMWKEFDFEQFENGSDEGYYVVDWHAQVDYAEPL